MLDKFAIKKVDGKTYLQLTPSLEWALQRALRYDFGRHTATTGDVAKALIELVPELTGTTLVTMCSDIKSFLEQRDRMIEVNDGKPLGIEIYEHDVEPNIKLLEAIEKEKQERGKKREF